MEESGEKYVLKWGNGVSSFSAFISQPFPALISERRRMIESMNERFQNEAHFMALCGFRLSEIPLAIEVLHEKGEAYPNERLMVHIRAEITPEEKRRLERGPEPDLLFLVETLIRGGKWKKFFNMPHSNTQPLFNMSKIS